ncbi:MAG: protoheme IX farnesyltransferase [Deltaproteobacteria bacterium RBG_16_71_12]|nr:MAG: protoheme IX farnesyltransferase [Deltaproteobacteria bacterium RBG_16_71_12]
MADASAPLAGVAVGGGARSSALGAPRALGDLLALTKPRITAMTLVVGGGAMLLTPGGIALDAAALVLLGMALVVGGAGALNMWLERDVDALMERTADRPLPARRLTPGAALALGLALSLSSLPLLWTAASPLTAGLAAFSLFVYVLVYTPMKRTSPWALVVGAVPGAMPALLGSTAVAHGFERVGLVLFAVAFLWQLPHFLAISIYRERDYVAAGHRVLSAVAGLEVARLALIGSSVALASMGVALWPLGVGGPAYAAVAVALGLWIVVLALRGAGDDRERTAAWARRVFLSSLVYQTMLFVALVADRLLFA